jgi:hypothetical protein
MGAAGKLMEDHVAQFLHRFFLAGRRAVLWKLWTWLDANIIDLGRQMRISYLPPLMVYIVGGGIAVSLVNILIFRGTGEMTEAMKAAVYTIFTRWPCSFQRSPCSGWSSPLY